MIYSVRLRLRSWKGWEKVKPYTTKGAFIFYAIGLGVIFLLIIPWVIGMIQYIKWIF